jgi:DNA-binding beta-propeller fold protein YncE
MLILGRGFAQTIPDAPAAVPSVAAGSHGVHANQPIRAFPRIHLWGNEELTYLGVFSSDAVFHTTSKLTGQTGYSPGEDIPPAPSTHQGPQPSDVPESMLLSNERVVENFDPPAHAEAVARTPTRLAEIRNRVVTYAYGRPSVLHAPRHVATDSHRRLIISDPEAAAVHVLDPAGKTSFRILTGKGRRLQMPAGVAVDADDNIYVADAERGMIVVFDSHGNFMRFIGSFHGENQYESPNGIAIDRKAGRLYLVDTPRNLVFMLDLSGKALKRLGKYHDGTGAGELDDPTDVVFKHNQVYVLDGSGTRVQIMDAECHPQASFNLPRPTKPKSNRENRLEADQQGNIYVSSFNSSVIYVYSQEGYFLASFGQPGRKVGEFSEPNGLWIDSANRLYVADSGNGRVQLFQLQAQR